MVFNMTNVYIVSTPYHLLITIVKTLLSHREGLDTVIIIHDNINKDVIKRSESIFKEITTKYNRFNIFTNIIEEKICQKIPLLSNSFTERAKLKDLFSNSKIFIFDDNSFFSCWLNTSRINYNLIEDGLNFFKMSPFLRTKRMKLYDCLYTILGIYWQRWGKSEFTQSIEVNENKDLKIRHRNIVVANREIMFKSLSEESIDTIANIFGFSSLKTIQQGPKTLLLTQPLSEDGILSHARKIKLYKNLIEHYSIGTLYIKPHPRETENYAEIFPNAIILGNSKIPFEVYQLKEKLHFDTAITAFSTAIDAIFCADNKVSKTKEWTLNFH